MTIKEAAKALKSGKTVIIPTETVYGVGADFSNDDAVRRLYEIKGRPSIKKLPVLVSGMEKIEELCLNPDENSRKIVERLMPGALTLVLKSKKPGETIGVRIPSHETAFDLLRESDLAIACTSANKSGQPSPVTFRDAVRNLGRFCPAALDGGDCTIAIESTVLDMSVSPPRIIRRGGISKRNIENTINSKIDGLTLFGISGGTGAGKTTALEVLKQQGALLLDCDKIYHELLLNDIEMITKLQKRFPDAVADLTVDRRKLGEIVFSDPAALDELNGITRPAVVKQCFRRIWEHENSGGKLAAIDAIGLFDKAMASYCDVTFAVTAPRETRLRRIIERDGLSPERAEARINAQPDEAFFESRADVILKADFDSPGEFSEYAKNVFDNYM